MSQCTKSKSALPEISQKTKQKKKEPQQEQDGQMYLFNNYVNAIERIL